MSNVTSRPPTSEAFITGVGITYISVAVIAIPLHVLCSWLMWKDKEMRNATYQFMINLSIADVVALIPIGIYAGIVILFRLPQNDNFERFLAFLATSGWYVNCVLFALIAFSRWVAITRPHLCNVIFTRGNLRLMHTIPWLIICIFYFFTCVLYPSPTLLFFTEVFTWGFDMTLPIGRYLHWHNFIFNTTCSIIETGFNIVSLNWVRKTRMTIQNLDTVAAQRRETKLLVQCALIGFVFSMVNVAYTGIFTSGTVTLQACITFQFLWTLNHVINPIVYLTVNTKLRRAFGRLITCKKLVQPNGETNQVQPQSHPDGSRG